MSASTGGGLAESGDLAGAGTPWARRAGLATSHPEANAPTGSLSQEPLDNAPAAALCQSSTADESESELAALRVRAAIRSLPEAQRLAVTLFYSDGMSCEQVAGFLGVSTMNVKVRLHRARKHLRKELLNMTEEALQKATPDTRFTEAVQAVIPVRVTMPFHHSVVALPGDTVLVYTHGGRVVVHGTTGDRLEVSGHKALWGQDRSEAQARAAEVVAKVERRRDVWSNPPHSNRAGGEPPDHGGRKLGRLFHRRGSAPTPDRRWSVRAGAGVRLASRSGQWASTPRSMSNRCSRVGRIDSRYSHTALGLPGSV